MYFPFIMDLGELHLLAYIKREQSLNLGQMHFIAVIATMKVMCKMDITNNLDSRHQHITPHPQQDRLVGWKEDTGKRKGVVEGSYPHSLKEIGDTTYMTCL